MFAEIHLQIEEQHKFHSRQTALQKDTFYAIKGHLLLAKRWHIENTLTINELRERHKWNLNLPLHFLRFCFAFIGILHTFAHADWFTHE